MTRRKNRAVARLPFTEELNHNERLDLIGKYFVDVTRRLIGGKKPKNHKVIGDIHHDGLDAILEAKASGSPSDLRIFTNQLERLMESADGFPGYSHCHYMLWFYRNWRQIRHGKKNGVARKPVYIRPLGKETPTEEDLNRFLARETVAVWFVDGSILQALSKREDSTKVSVQWHRPSMIVRANRRLLQTIVDDPVKRLASLKLDPNAFLIRRMKVAIRFRRNLMRFEITLILPKKQARSITKLIRERIVERNAKKKAT